MKKFFNTNFHPVYDSFYQWFYQFNTNYKQRNARIDAAIDNFKTPMPIIDENFTTPFPIPELHRRHVLFLYRVEQMIENDPSLLQLKDKSESKLKHIPKIKLPHQFQDSNTPSGDGY